MASVSHAPGEDINTLLPCQSRKVVDSQLFCFAQQHLVAILLSAPYAKRLDDMKLVPFTSKSVSYFDDMQIIFQSKSCLNFPVLVLVHGRNTICTNHETRSKQNSMSCRLRYSDCRTQALTKDSQRYTLHFFQFSNNTPKQQKVHSFWCVNHGQWHYVGTRMLSLRW